MTVIKNIGIVLSLAKLAWPFSFRILDKRYRDNMPNNGDLSILLNFYYNKIITLYPFDLVLYFDKVDLSLDPFENTEVLAILLLDFKLWSPTDFLFILLFYFIIWDIFNFLVH